MAVKSARRGVTLRERLGWGITVAVGYILSPLSWWNDAFVNIPIALAAAKVLERLGVDFKAGFYAAYAATNVAGMVMVIVGSKGVVRGYASRKELVKAVLAAIAYSVAMYPLLSLIAG